MRPLLAAVLGLLLAVAAVAAWRLTQQQRPGVAPPAAAPGLTLASEADLAAETPETLTLHRFAANPRILVFDFPSLREQALMFNRIAAFAEKAGQPHDRVLSDAELAAVLHAGGETMETYYYGHDYGSETIRRFFNLADEGRIALNPEEEKLRGIAQRQGLLAPSAGQAVITLPRLQTDAQIDDSFRRAILHHELSHGEFFTDPAFAAYAEAFYRDTLNDGERAAFARFLGAEGYDTSLPDLIANETQAYLMFTPDTRFFSPRAVGLDTAEIAGLRARFVAGMPAGWLRDGAAR